MEANLRTLSMALLPLCEHSMRTDLLNLFFQSFPMNCYNNVKKLFAGENVGSVPWKRSGDSSSSLRESVTKASHWEFDAPLGLLYLPP